MGDRFLESIGISNSILFSQAGSFNIVHQIGDKIEGGFVNQILMCHFLKKNSTSEDNPKVLLVLTHHSYSHWISVCNTLGLDIQSLQENGTIVVVDLLKNIYESMQTFQPRDTDVFSFCSVQHISSQCEKNLLNFKTAGSKRILVIIEDLTNLLNHSDSEKQILEFLVNLKSLSFSSFIKDKCSIVVNSLIHSQDFSIHSSDQIRFAVMMSQLLSTVMFELCPLSTGFSSQVTGFLKVVCNAQGDSDITNNVFDVPFIRSFHFKLDGCNVRATPI